MLKHYYRNIQGQFSVIFSLIVMLLMVGAGVAVDMSQMTRASTHLQDDLDAAVLAAAKEYVRTGKKKAAKNAGANVFTQNSGMTNKRVIKFNRDGTIAARHEYQLKLSLMHMFMDKEQLTVAGEAVISLDGGATPVDVVIALDMTSSMYNYIDQTKAALVGLLDQFAELNTTRAGTVRLSLVPYADAVKVDPSFYGQSWLQDARANPSAPFHGCLLARHDPNWRATDADPVSGSAASLYKIQERHSVDFVCETSYNAIIPKTPYILDVIKSVQKYDKDNVWGNTDIALGMVWAKNMLTPETVPYQFPDDGRKKIIILMTDGQNTFFDADNKPMQRSYADRVTLDACLAAKNDGIEVYTINLIDGNSAMLRKCATDPDKHYKVKNISQLHGAFDDIYDTIFVGSDLALIH